MHISLPMRKPLLLQHEVISHNSTIKYRKGVYSIPYFDNVLPLLPPSNPPMHQAFK